MELAHVKVVDPNLSEDDFNQDDLTNAQLKGFEGWHQKWGMMFLQLVKMQVGFDFLTYI
jgi:hypothetical protein